MTVTDLTLTPTVDASGTATATIRPTGRQTWTVQQVSISMGSAGAAASCALYKNGVAVTPLVATMDAAAGDPPVILHPSDTMTVVWTGATVGAIGSVLVLYDDGQG
jgi:hypothetical protein